MAQENLQLRNCAHYGERCIPAPNGCAGGIFENCKDHEKDGEQNA